MKKGIGMIFFILCTILLYGCGPEKKTSLYFESYNELENLPGEEHTAYNFNFSINQKRYQVMRGDEAEELQYIDQEEDNLHKIVLADAEKNILFSMDTEKGYAIASIRECTDKDGKVYIMYSKYDSGLINLFIDDLVSTYVMEINIEEDKAEIEKQYDFGPSIFVLTVHNGYVYTMVDGRVYRKLLDGTGDKECMADLGFRGMPDFDKMHSLRFCIKESGIQIVAQMPNPQKKYTFIRPIIADVKYTDQPIEVDD